MNFENQLKIGNGIYTIPEISKILRLPNPKVNRWIKQFWDGKIGNEYNQRYSWNIDLTKAVSFHTLIELYSFYQLSSVGVRSNKILEAHSILSKQFSTAFPFANSNILQGIKTDGKNVFFDIGDQRIYSLDTSRQFNLGFISIFFKKLDFDDDSLASRLWPIGKEKSIVCDPKRKFGLPVINNKNIYPETIFDMHEAGDSVDFLTKTYSLTETQVQHAIEYCKQSA
jgi:uncharacterized protein (DUF433 family)